MINNRIRLSIVQVLVLLAFATLVGRLFYMQGVKHQFFKSKSSNQLKRIITIYSKRGNIYDRNRQPLAVTRKSYSAYLVPQEIKNKKKVITILSKIVKVSKKNLAKQLNSNLNFIWLKRKLTSAEYNALKANQ